MNIPASDDEDTDADGISDDGDYAVVEKAPSFESMMDIDSDSLVTQFSDSETDGDNTTDDDSEDDATGVDDTETSDPAVNAGQDNGCEVKDGDADGGELDDSKAGDHKADSQHPAEASDAHAQEIGLDCGAVDVAPVHAPNDIVAEKEPGGDVDEAEMRILAIAPITPTAHQDQPAFNDAPYIAPLYCGMAPLFHGQAQVSSVFEDPFAFMNYAVRTLLLYAYSSLTLHAEAHRVPPYA